MKRCTKCGKLKPLYAFYRVDKACPEKRHLHCKSCQDAYRQQRSAASRQWIREYAARWARKSRHIVDSATAFIDQSAASDVRLTDYYRLRHAALLAYGGYRCACCGATEALFLTIDHMNNDGTRHRRRVGASINFFRWLKKKSYPRGFQVLCSNCNHGRYRNGGVCPHKDPVGKGRGESSFTSPEGRGRPRKRSGEGKR